MFERWLAGMVWNADGGGDGGGAAGAGGAGGDGGGEQKPAGGLAAAAAAAKPAEGVKPADGAGAADWFPKDLDAKFKGKDAAETVANLAKHLGEMPKPPAEAKAYAWEASDKLKPYLGDKNDSKVVDAFRDVALKHGLHQGQFAGVINDFYGSLIEQGLIEAPVDLAGEFAKLGGTMGDTKTKLEAGQQRVVELAGWINGLVGRNELAKGEAQALVDGLGSADLVVALEKVMTKAYGAKPAGPAGGGKPSDGMTDHERALKTLYPTMFNAA